MIPCFPGRPISKQDENQVFKHMGLWGHCTVKSQQFHWNMDLRKYRVGLSPLSSYFQDRLSKLFWWEDGLENPAVPGVPLSSGSHMDVFMDVRQILPICPLEGWPPTKYIKYTNFNSARTKVIVRKGVGTTKVWFIFFKIQMSHYKLKEGRRKKEENDNSFYVVSPNWWKRKLKYCLLVI